MFGMLPCFFFGKVVNCKDFYRSDMSKRMLIALCTLVAVSTAVIVAGVYALYEGVGSLSACCEGSAEDATVQFPPDDHAPVSARSESSPVPAPSDSLTGNPHKGGKEVFPCEYSVTNCRSGKKNTLRQKEDLSLELLDEKGTLLWTYGPLEGRICGAVGEADYFYNKKIQFLFSDGVRIHLLDRLGRQVKGFPKTVGCKVVGGPEKVIHKGALYWRFDTEEGPLYYDRKFNTAIKQLP